MLKKSFSLLGALILVIVTQAQTMNVEVGDVVYQYPAAQTGDMTYTEGTSLTVLGKTYAISDITKIYVDETEVTDNVVTVAYDGTSAKVYVAGNVAQYVTPEISGAHVSIAQSADVSDDNVGEITYTLSGNATDGEFYLTGSYKSTVELNGVTLVNLNPVYSGAAVNIQNGKRIDISVKKDTENSLTDATSGDQKACLVVKGHGEFKGKGTLNVYGLLKHGIKTGEYMTVKNCTINVLSAAGDGLHANEYFLMESGVVTLDGVGDDGLQVELDGTASTGETTDHEDEDSGNIYLQGGTFTATATATATKGVKGDGSIYVTDGTITLNAKGDIDLTDTTDPSYTAGFKAGDNFVMSGGDVTVNVTGGAGRGVSAETALTTNGGTLTVTNSGATSSSGSSYFCTAKGLKAPAVVLNDGTITVTMSGAASKGIKADEGDLTITGGTINVTTTGAGAYDGTEKDAKGCSGINADGNITITGGTITLKSSGTGGKCMKCDGLLTVNDGTITATSTGSQYKYSSSYTSSAKAIKAGLYSNKTYTGGIVVTGGSIVAKASTHEAIESKSTIDISGGHISATSSDDAINSASTFTVSDGYVMGYSTGNDGLDANGNFYIKGGVVYAIGTTTPEVGIDANTEGGYQLYVQGGTLVAIAGLENNSSLTQSCYSTSSWSGNTWHALYNSGNLALAFKTPSNNGTTMVVSTSGTTTLKSGVSISGGTEIFSGMGNIGCTVSGGNTVSLSDYNGGGGGGTPGGGGGPGGGGTPGGGGGPGGGGW